MALIKCHECGNKVSTTAKACPKCGAEVRVLVKESDAEKWAKLSRPRKAFAVGGTILIWALMWSALRSCSESTDQRTTDPKMAALAAKRKAQEDKRFAAMEAAKTALRAAARDPDSLRYEDWSMTLDGSLVCVGVNGKNAFGGYSGWKEYAYTGGELSGRLDDLDKTCFNKKLDLYPVTETGRLKGDATK